MKYANSVYICTLMNKSSHSVGRKRAMVMVSLITCLVFFLKVFGSYAFVAEQVVSFKAASAASSLSHDSGSHPFFPQPDPFEPPAPDEAESKDECDDEVSKLLAHLSPKISDRLHAKKRLLSHLKVSIENRSSVSLFILYHCWKSFPG